jgi:hypothetical protein
MGAEAVTSRETMTSRDADVRDGGRGSIANTLLERVKGIEPSS